MEKDRKFIIKTLYTVDAETKLYAWAQGKFFTQNPFEGNSHVISLELKNPLIWPDHFSNVEGSKKNLDELLFPIYEIDTLIGCLEMYKRHQEEDDQMLIEYFGENGTFAYLSIPFKEQNQLIRSGICLCGCQDDPDCQNRKNHLCECCKCCAWPRRFPGLINTLDAGRNACYCIPLEIKFGGSSATAASLFKNADKRRKDAILIPDRANVVDNPSLRKTNLSSSQQAGEEEKESRSEAINGLRMELTNALNMFITCTLLMANLLYPCEDYFRTDAMVKPHPTYGKKGISHKYKESRRIVNLQDMNLTIKDWYPDRIIHNDATHIVDRAIYDQIWKENNQIPIKPPLAVITYASGLSNGTSEFIPPIFELERSIMHYNRPTLELILSNMSQTVSQWVITLIDYNALFTNFPPVNEMQKKFETENLKDVIDEFLQNKEFVEIPSPVKDWIEMVLILCDHVVSDVFCWAVEILTSKQFTFLDLIPLFKVCGNKDLESIASVFYPMYELAQEGSLCLIDQETGMEIGRKRSLPINPTKIPFVIKWFAESQKTGENGTLGYTHVHVFHRLKYLVGFMIFIRMVYPDFGIERVKMDQKFVAENHRSGKGKKKQDVDNRTPYHSDHLPQFNLYHLLYSYQNVYIEDAHVESIKFKKLVKSEKGWMYVPLSISEIEEHLTTQMSKTDIKQEGKEEKEYETKETKEKEKEEKMEHEAEEILSQLLNEYQVPDPEEFDRILQEFQEEGEKQEDQK